VITLPDTGSGSGDGGTLALATLLLASGVALTAGVAGRLRTVRIRR
jgi:hypothetical protein